MSTNREQVRVLAAVGIYNSTGTCICQFNSEDVSRLHLTLMREREHYVIATLTNRGFAPGSYHVSMAVMDVHSRTLFDRVEHVVSFDVPEADFFGTGRRLTGKSLVAFPCGWEECSVNGQMNQ
jgi:hypothetical protein